jgi:hypothetical protein
MLPIAVAKVTAGKADEPGAANREAELMEVIME